MKILYFYQYFATSNGSWGTRVHEFTKEWVKEGQEVTVVTSVYSKSDISASGFIETKYFEGVKVIIINVRIDNRQPFLKRIFSFLAYSLISCWYAVTYSCDLVIASSGPITVGLPGLLAKYLRGRKLVFEVRDLWPDGAIELGIIKNPILKKFSLAFEKLCYKSSSLVVALSEGMRNEILIKAPDTNVISVTNAANIELFSTPVEFPKDFPVKPHQYAIYTGNIGEVNNSVWLLETARILQEKGEEDIQILIIGEGQQRELIDQAIKAENLTTLIRLGLMPKYKLVPLIQHAMVSLVPLKGSKILDTSSPNKFFESLSAGIPVIQNTQGWMKEFLEANKIGFTLSPNDPNQLAELLIHVKENQGELQEMGQRSMEIARKEFDAEFLARKMLNGILEVAS
ncbi:Glycosyltransferase involved in cell wall bisynthesis [Algoriphagus locisalis]|uniref:Glycosyltransferase involved in cell wall bisynthesis n=1 Tax=Algoriphagus locisalis TaxID=305507 RepID=A0A1I6XQI9_9BACT|nr:glycosyltransferase family 4 protein [Algoriphagus locisalis]SFT40436.1 Glycosyltransferase involved in cell wall bisynthesis [Algoriphagus locisalis]